MQIILMNTMIFNRMPFAYSGRTEMYPVLILEVCVLLLFPLAITQIENDDDRAFMEEVYVEYRHLYCSVAQEYVSLLDSEDIVQDACEKLCNRIPRLREMLPSVLRLYSVTIVRHTAIDYLRQQNRIKEHMDDLPEDEFAEIASVDVAVEEAVLQRAHIEDVRRAIDKLPKRQEEVMMMRYFDDMSIREIAEILGLSENNVYGTIKRARARITVMLKSEETD
jgi:RNA polymerase sigma-70 factor (ECF subfamily)